MYVLTKISWSGFISQTAERKNLDSKVEARRTWLSKWMKFSHQNFMVRFYRTESSLALTDTQRCKHKELDCLKGCRLFAKTSWTRFISQRAQWQELGFKGGSRKNLTSWMILSPKFPGQVLPRRELNCMNFGSNVQAQRTWLYRNGCRFSYQSFLVRFYLAESSMSWTLDLKTVP